MTNEDQKVVFSLSGVDSLPERLDTYDGFTEFEDQTADFATGLVSLGFIKASLRRRARLWCTTAVIGLLAGCGLYAESPPIYQASTSLLLTPGPYENINTAASNDEAMAQTRTVAGLAVRELGLQQSAGSFLTTYKVAPITERVIVIKASARSSSQALLNVSAIATAFLKFRAQEMQTEENLILASLNQQISQTQQHLSSIDSQISQLSAQPASPTQKSQLKDLRTEQTQATATLFNLRQAAIGNQTNNQTATATAVKDSTVLDTAVPLAHSTLKPLVLDAAVGLIVGLLVGMAIVVLQALMSDRLRRRDDVARAIGAPVRLSVGTLGLKRRLLGRFRRSAARDASIQRIAEHLSHILPDNSQGMAALAVVPVDDLEVPALSLVSLALSCARQGRHVVVADLCSGAPAARLLGAREPGISEVNVRDARLVVAVPERDDAVPVGPLYSGPTPAQRPSFTEAIGAACASANLLLTMATVDPMLGGEHLTTWATDAVAMVTAGQSSSTKIHSAGELVRMSGTRLVSVVLVGADSTDESLGMAWTPETV